MKSISNYVIIAILLTVVACNSQQVVKAKVFERREEPGNKLLIKYNYSYNNTQYTDSALIDNISIGPDTIDVKVDGKNPGKSEPQVSKAQ